MIQPAAHRFGQRRTDRGGVLALALLITFVIERQALASVWCFFAAISSAFIVIGIGEDHRLVVKVA